MDPDLNAQTPCATGPLVSVVVPIHNGAVWIAETLQSLLQQSYCNLEVVLIDDASTDDLVGALATFDDSRLRVHRLQSNQGVSAARNTGIRLAQGEYIAFCDADDISLPHRLEKQVRLLQMHREIDVCGSAFTCFGTTEESTIRHPEGNAQIRRGLMVGNCFGLSTVIGKAAVFKQSPFDESLGLAEDYDLWTRLAMQGHVLANLMDSLVRYRLHEQQASKGKGERLDQQSRKVRARYCAALLGNDAVREAVSHATVTMADLRLAASVLAQNQGQPGALNPRDFRFLLAWMYQCVDSHGPAHWMQWMGIQRRLHLQLNKNYRLNNLLLALLEPMLSSAQADLLLKLKT